MRYKGFIENAWILYPINDEVLDKIYSNINPIKPRTGEKYKKSSVILLQMKNAFILLKSKSLKKELSNLRKRYPQKNTIS